MTRCLPQMLLLLAALAAGATGAVAGDGNNGRGRSADNPRNEHAAGFNMGGGRNEFGGGRNEARPERAVTKDTRGMLPATGKAAELRPPEGAAEESLSLAEVRAALALISDGRMLDISIVRVDDALAYQVTVLEAGNVARHILIDARTGREVGSAP